MTSAFRSANFINRKRLSAGHISRCMAQVIPCYMLWMRTTILFLKYQQILVRITGDVTKTIIFTARRNARIASTVLATAIPYVCPSVRRLSVCHTLVLCQNDCKLGLLNYR